MCLKWALYQRIIKIVGYFISKASQFLTPFNVFFWKLEIRFLDKSLRSVSGQSKVRFGFGAGFQTEQRRDSDGTTKVESWKLVVLREGNSKNQESAGKHEDIFWKNRSAENLTSDLADFCRNHNLKIRLEKNWLKIIKKSEPWNVQENFELWFSGLMDLIQVFTRIEPSFTFQVKLYLHLIFSDNS